MKTSTPRPPWLADTTDDALRFAAENAYAKLDEAIQAGADTNAGCLRLMAGGRVHLVHMDDEVLSIADRARAGMEAVVSFGAASMLARGKIWG